MESLIRATSDRYHFYTVINRDPLIQSELMRLSDLIVEAYLAHCLCFRLESGQNNKRQQVTTLS